MSKPSLKTPTSKATVSGWVDKSVKREIAKVAKADKRSESYIVGDILTKWVEGQQQAA